MSNRLERYLKVLQSWLGWSTAKGQDDIIIDIYNSQRTEKYKVSHSDPWCHATVSAAAYKSGNSDIIPNTAYCPTGVNWFKSRGQWVQRSQIQVGDIVYYDWGGDGVSDHVGTCIKRSGNTIIVREGNKHGMVSDRTISKSNKCIMGAGRPDWNKEEGNMPILKNGSTGTAVAMWQLALGFTGSDVDGEYGPKTETATREFQSAHGLAADGEAGPDTYNAYIKEHK